jgi:hypothetical protein
MLFSVETRELLIETWHLAKFPKKSWRANERVNIMAAFSAFLQASRHLICFSILPTSLNLSLARYGIGDWLMDGSEQ